MKKTVALIFGGEGKEREISKKSAENLRSFIDEKLYTTLMIEITESGSWYIISSDGEHETYPVRISDKSGFLYEESLISTDAVIPALHGNKGEDGVIQGALEAAHIPYIGQDVYASAITSDKAYTKLAAEHLKIPTAKWIYSVNESTGAAKKRAEEKLGYPMFIKPSRLGSSYGASPVRDESEFEKAFALAFAEGDARVLIEELADIEYELECAYFNDGIKRISPDGKINTGGTFYDFSLKYEKYTEAKTDKDGDESIKSKAVEYSDKLIDFLGLRSLSRIDFFVTSENNIIFNEINTFPGMTHTSLYPRLCENFGFEKGEFINRLLKKACR